MEPAEETTSSENSPEVSSTVEEKARKEPSPKRKIILLSVFGVLILALGAGSWFFYFGKLVEKQKPPSPGEVGKVIKPPVEGTSLAKVFSDLTLPQVFAEFKIEKSTVIPSLSDYTLSSAELSNLANIEETAEIKFSPSQLEALEEAGFFIQPTKPEVSDSSTPIDPRFRIDDMVDWYRKIGGPWSMYSRKPENAVFVTTDCLLHVYHAFIDKTFQKIEETKWHPILKSLSQKFFEDSLSHYQGATDSAVKESFKRLTVFHLVPLTILDTAISKPKDLYMTPDEYQEFQNRDKAADSDESIKAKLSSFKTKVPKDIYDLAEKELDLVLKAEGFDISPLFGKLNGEAGLQDLEDYSQYKPRSHYTKNSLLRTYFRAMIWYGRHGFDTKSLDLTRDALHTTWALENLTVGGEKVFDLWEKIYLPTVFFVGRSDDLTVYDYSEIMEKVYGAGTQMEDLSDKTKLLKFQEEAKKLSGPKILSQILYGEKIFETTKEELLAETKGFRFMGQRFIPDSYMFTRLTQGDEPADPETGQKLPSTPTALMIMSILGSETANELLDDWVAINAPDSDKVIAKVKGELTSEFSELDEGTWTQNIYWSWLYTLKPLFEKFGSGYPMFMRGLAWAKKGLQAALGSWTELRHDTLLYAKQSYAELGAGGPGEEVPPVPRGYVEPNLEFFERIIALSKMTRDGLKSRELLTEEREEKINRFIKASEFLKLIAEKELTGSDISDDDYERLRVIGHELAPVLYPLEGEIITEREARSGIIADVHTDALEGQILYEATGVPSIIYVAVKDKGGTRLTRGVVYSYYEFTEPLAIRLSDEDWQGRIYEGKEPEKVPSPPSWTQDLIQK